MLAFVARGHTAKVRNLRRDPRVALTFRHGWEWVAVHGRAELVGPDDPAPWADAARLPGVLRDVYHAAGGRHPDLDAYDQAMAAERRVAVLINPTRFVANPPGTDHQEPT